jgi:hypothetical protein
MGRRFGAEGQSSSLPEQASDNLVAAHFEMAGDFGEDAGHRPEAQGVVSRDSQVVLSMLQGSKADVTSGLASHFVCEYLESPDKLASREIAWQPHTAITSSLTK